MESWQTAQEFEASWWGDCVNTYMQETDQITVARLLGLDDPSPWEGRWPVYEVHGRRIVDIGCGPCSLLLKVMDFGAGSTVVDPCPYPDWVWQRYQAHGLYPMNIRAEGLPPLIWDEAWIYNVLQHVDDPETVIRVTQKAAPVLRVFEWIDVPAYEGHPHELKEADLNSWLGGEGETYWWENYKQLGYYGVFGTSTPSSGSE